MQTFTTPMMKQYLEIKKKYMDCLLFYRMGDFYELFLEDAKIGAEILNITLTSRPKGKDGRIPMAGVPFHAVDIYVAKLVQAGEKVAICEQMTPPGKGIIEREVVRIVTPGTMLDEKALEKKDNNYIISLCIGQERVGISLADFSTGYFAVEELPFQNIAQILQNELGRIQPSECILPINLYNDANFLQVLHRQPNMNIYCFQEWEKWSSSGRKVLEEQFGVKTLAGFGIEEEIYARQAAAALIGYLRQTQMSHIGHIRKLQHVIHSSSMQLDRSTIFNLELFYTIREQTRKGSVLSVIDQTVTPMGGRLLKNWMRTPLRDKNDIIKRHEVVAELVEKQFLRSNLRKELSSLADIERILSRLTLAIGNARDLITLQQSLQCVLSIKQHIVSCSSPLLQQLHENLSYELQEIISYIEGHIQPEPPIDLRGGGIIRRGVDKKLDTLHAIIVKSKKWIALFEQTERERTGIGSLKVRFNSVYGYYIEVSKANLHAIPDNYSRKQTLVNGERFMTPELKKQEEVVLRSEEKMHEIEYKLFQAILNQIISYTKHVQVAAETIAILDCLVSFAQTAEERNYIRAVFTDEKMSIKQGRHPVVETLLLEQRFVPNDVLLEHTVQELLLITGPNMAGKSVFIRQVALIVLLNQIGSFVPASEAYLPLVDRVFVRSGASDVITQGLSTFMVEMVETAYILHHATENSLIIMDEIGRGTSTYDGISIAWAVADYLATKFVYTPKTLFATHYHELQKLEKEHSGVIVNYHMSVENKKNQPIFLHTLMRGGASHSFGIAVAHLAGVPSEVEEKASKMLAELEKRSSVSSSETSATSNGSHATTLIDRLLSRELQNIDISQMTPLEALNTLAELKEQIKVVQRENEQEFLEKD